MLSAQKGICAPKPEALMPTGPRTIASVQSTLGSRNPSVAYDAVELADLAAIFRHILIDQRDCGETICG